MNILLAPHLPQLELNPQVDIHQVDLEDSLVLQGLEATMDTRQVDQVVKGPRADTRQVPVVLDKGLQTMADILLVLQVVRDRPVDLVARGRPAELVLRGLAEMVTRQVALRMDKDPPVEDIHQLDLAREDKDRLEEDQELVRRDRRPQMKVTLAIDHLSHFHSQEKVSLRDLEVALERDSRPPPADLLNSQADNTQVAMKDIQVDDPEDSLLLAVIQAEVKDLVLVPKVHQLEDIQVF